MPTTAKQPSTRNTQDLHRLMSALRRLPVVTKTAGRVTKPYTYPVMCWPFGTKIRQRSIGSLVNVVFRARLMPGHIIRIEGYRNSDSRRSTRSAERLAKHVGKLLLASSITEERLEFQIIGPHISSTLFAPQWVVVHLYPRIASLCDEPGAPDLSYEEVMSLSGACKSFIEDSYDPETGRTFRSD